MNESLKQLIRIQEGCSLKPYKDDKLSTVKVEYAIGYGHQIKPDEDYLMKGITQEKADDLLEDDLKDYSNAVDISMQVLLNENERSALISLCYNIGINAFAHSTLVKKINLTSSKDEIEKHWKEWNKSGGKVNPGLVKRRDAEFRLYMMPLAL